MNKYFELRYLFDFVIPCYVLIGVALIALILIVCVKIARAWKKRQDRLSEEYWEENENGKAEREERKDGEGHTLDGDLIV